GDDGALRRRDHRQCGEPRGKYASLKAGAPAIAPGWTLDLMARHSLDFWLTSEDLPAPDNRVTLDRDGGVVLSYQPNNEEAHRRLIAKLKSLMAQQTKCRVHG